MIAGGSLAERHRERRRARVRPGDRARRAGSARCPRRRRTRPPRRSADVAYVIGGRGATVDTPTDADRRGRRRARGRVRAAGALAPPRSDLAAVALGGRILARRRPRAGRHGRGARASSSRRSTPSDGAPAARGDAARTSTRTTAPNMLDRRRARRAAARLRAEQRERHRRRDRPAHAIRVVEHFAVGAPAAARRAGVGPEDALRHERRRQQPDADRPAHRQARRGRSRSTTRTTCTSRPTAATRSSSPSGCTGSTSATRTRSRCTARSPVPCARRRPHGLLRRRPLPARELRVLGAARQGRRRARAGRRRARPARRRARDAAGREALARRHASSTSPTCTRTALWEIDGAPAAACSASSRPAPARTASTRAATRSYLYVDEPRRGLDLGDQLRARGKVVAKWRIPGGGSPDMGGVSADGKVLWLSGRYNGVVYAISTRNGRLLAQIPVGAGPARPLRLAAAGPLLARPHRRSSASGQPAMERTRDRPPAGRARRRGGRRGVAATAGRGRGSRAPTRPA